MIRFQHREKLVRFVQARPGRRGERPLEREWLRWALRRRAAGVTERLLLDAAEVLEVALESRELAPLGPRERLRPR
ncbi:hypothetical protein MTO96_007997 [Rhipicephalus appendiculatus]